MTTTINAGFNRRRPGTMRVQYEWKNAVGLTFPVPYEQVTVDMVANHKDAPSYLDGWVVQGWCEATPADTERRLQVEQARDSGFAVLL